MTKEKTDGIYYKYWWHTKRILKSALLRYSMVLEHLHTLIWINSFHSHSKDTDDYKPSIVRPLNLSITDQTKVHRNGLTMDQIGLIQHKSCERYTVRTLFSINHYFFKYNVIKWAYHSGIRPITFASYLSPCTFQLFLWITFLFCYHIVYYNWFTYVFIPLNHIKIPL